ncbi:MAG: hypothetical protein SFU98_22475 [Leptospiraceae bacterium]|nr:hypothetical protein [Leptospiraceae bacterium]
MKLIIFLFFLISCSNQDSFKKEDAKNKTNILALSYIRNSGNCLRKETISKEKQIIRCSRINLGLCDNRYLLYNNSDKIKRLDVLNKMNEKTQKCQAFIAASNLLTQNIDTLEEENKIKANNFFQPTNSCEGLGLSSEKVLFSSSELEFFFTDRGKMGEFLETQSNLSFVLPTLPTTWKEDAKECLEKNFTNTEKELLSINRKLERLKELSCENGSGSLKNCPTQLQ